MSPKQKRLAAIAAIALLLALAVGLVLGALRENIVFFYTPSEIPATAEFPPRKFRPLRKAARSVLVGWSRQEA